MTSHAAQAAAKTAADNAKTATPADTRALHVVADATGHSTLGENQHHLGDWEHATDAAHQDAEDAKIAGTEKTAGSRKPRAPRATTPAASATPKPGTNPKVSMDTRRPVLVAWMIARKTFTTAEVCAAEAPSPMSALVCSYTLGTDKKPPTPSWLPRSRKPGTRSATATSRA